MKQSNKQLIHDMVAKDVKKQRQRDQEHNQAILRTHAQMLSPYRLYFLPKQQSSKERFIEIMER